MPNPEEMELFTGEVAERRSPEEARERRNGRYAQEKLSFLNRYLPPALRATKSKLTRHYIDLFAAHGRFRDERGVIHEGSALRALTIGGAETGDISFTDATLINLDPQHHHALMANVQQAGREGRLALPFDRIAFMNEDANAAIASVLRRIHRKSYVFVFADPESPNQLPWTTIQALRAQGHESIDLYVLFPLHMGIVRMVAWDERKLEPNVPALTRFFGTDEWRDLVSRRRTDNDRRRLVGDLEELYVRRLRELGWKHTGRVREIRRQGEHRLYNMLFATNHPVGAALAEWETKPAQRDMFSAHADGSS
jgi:three-Cys-motif partner protein